MKLYAYTTFFAGMLLSGIAAFFSVSGLAMIFAGSFKAVVVLATTLELAKLVSATWLFRYRQLASRPVRVYLYLATIVLMIITSLGIFGYLSRAHVDIEAGSTQAQLTLDEINQRESAIVSQKDQLTKELDSVTTQSDKLVEQLGASNRLTRENGAVQVQRENAKRRESILGRLEATNKQLTDIKRERIETQASVNKATADIGPLRYVASAIYGNESTETIRKAVIWLTILLMIVFDPMAIMLLIAANILFLKLAEPEEEDEEEIPSVSVPSAWSNSGPVETPVLTTTPWTNNQWFTVTTETKEPELTVEPIPEPEPVPEPKQAKRTPAKIMEIAVKAHKDATDRASELPKSLRGKNAVIERESKKIIDKSEKKK